MQSQPPRARAWFVATDDLPDGEDVVPIRTKHGLAIACRKSETSDRLLKGLNEAAAFVLGVGLAQINDNEKPPERKE